MYLIVAFLAGMSFQEAYHMDRTGGQHKAIVGYSLSLLVLVVAILLEW